MLQQRQHFGYKFAVLLITACLMLPLSVKLFHAISHHEHEICLGENQSHLHEIDMDCEFFKFKINHTLYYAFEEFKVLAVEFPVELPKTYHKYLKSHQQLQSYLRGPPLLV